MAANGLTCNHTLSSFPLSLSLLDSTPSQPQSSLSLSPTTPTKVSRLPLPLRKTHNSPFPTPRPPPALTLTTLLRLQLLIPPLRQPNNNIRLARPQRQHIDPRAPSQRPNGLHKRRRGSPRRIGD